MNKYLILPIMAIVLLGNTMTVQASGESIDFSTNPVTYDCGTSDKLEVYDITADTYLVGWADSDSPNCGGTLTVVDGNEYEGDFLLGVNVQQTFAGLFGVALTAIGTFLEEVKDLIIAGLIEYGVVGLVILGSVTTLVVGYIAFIFGIKWVRSFGIVGYSDYDGAPIYKNKKSTGSF